VAKLVANLLTFIVVVFVGKVGKPSSLEKEKEKQVTKPSHGKKRSY